MTNEEAKKNITAYVYAEFENIPKQVIDALDIARQAIDKQTPKKPITKKLANDGYAWEWTCPCCNMVNVTIEYNCCPRCGQKIDWSEIE